MKTVIELNGRQFSVSPGDRVKVDSNPKKVGAKLHPQRVVLHQKEGKLLIGEAADKAVKVSLAVADNLRDKKVAVRRYKSKSRYRRNNNHRQNKVILEVLEIKEA